jgi:hypothetical protein
MRAIHALSILLISFLVVACATDVNTRQPLSPMSVGSLQFGEIDAASTLASVTPDHINRLKMSVSERVGKLPQGNVPVRIQMSVTEFDIQSGAARFFIGAFAGSNKMTVTVKIMDPMGNTIADFDVQRSANPGGYGAFYSQTNATIDAIADGVADVLGGMSGASRDL